MDRADIEQYKEQFKAATTDKERLALEEQFSRQANTEHKTIIGFLAVATARSRQSGDTNAANVLHKEWEREQERWAAVSELGIQGYINAEKVGDMLSPKGTHAEEISQKRQGERAR